jgi:hypothetical protein
MESHFTCTERVLGAIVLALVILVLALMQARCRGETMDTAEAREKISETITATRKVFKNEAWQAWADAWPAGTDQTSESAMAMADEMALLFP